MHYYLLKRKLFVTAILLAPFLVPSVYAFEDSDRDPVVRNVSFEGNETYRGMVLSQVIATSDPSLIQKMFGRYSNFPFSENEVLRDQIRLQRYYQRRGFHNVEVDFEVNERRKEWQKDVTFFIREGSPIRITSSEVVIDADETTKQEIREARDFRRAVQRHEFRDGQRYQLIRMADAEGRFLQTLENLGYAWPEVEVTAEVDSAANSADVQILLRPNSKTYFSEFQIEGDITVPERILLRQTDINIGDPYSRDQIQAAQRSIFNHHLFRFATITLPEQEKDSTLTALIRVREYEPRTIQAAIGIGREEIVRGQAIWQHRNISGTGHRFGVNLRASFIEQRAGSDYLIPYIFNARSSNVSSIFGVHRLEPAYELFQAGFSSSLIYQIRRNQTASFSYEFSINEELSRRQDFELPESVLTYTVSSLKFSGYYSQGMAREQRGWVVQPSAELSGLFGEASFTFQKFTLDVRRFTPLTSSTLLAKRVNSGIIFYESDDTLPSNIRFYSGGTNTVRGWTRQSLGPSLPSFDNDGNFKEYVPTGGKSMFSFNIELRQQLTRIIPNFGIAAFLDGGQVWENADLVDDRPIQFGAGGGLRYQSPIGPVRIDVAYKLNPSDKDLNIFDGQDFGSPWDRIGIHFSIGQAF